MQRPVARRSEVSRAVGANARPGGPSWSALSQPDQQCSGAEPLGSGRHCGCTRQCTTGSAPGISSASSIKQWQARRPDSASLTSSGSAARSLAMLITKVGSGSSYRSIWRLPLRPTASRTACRKVDNSCLNMIVLAGVATLSSAFANRSFGQFCRKSTRRSRSSHRGPVRASTAVCRRARSRGSQTGSMATNARRWW